MDGSPDFLTSIEFAEAKKGYEREQVDNFLRELSVRVSELKQMLLDTTQRADSADAKVAEAQRAKAIAEAVAEKARADLTKAKQEPAASSPTPDAIESAAGVLALAQKTADAAISEAQTKATQIISQARETAAKAIAEVKDDAEKIKAEASKAADALLSERSANLDREVAELSRKRDALNSELTELRQRLDQQKATLRKSAEAITQLLDESDRAIEPGTNNKPTAETSATVTTKSEPVTESKPSPTKTSPKPSAAADQGRSNGGGDKSPSTIAHPVEDGLVIPSTTIDALALSDADWSVDAPVPVDADAPVSGDNGHEKSDDAAKISALLEAPTPRAGGDTAPKPDPARSVADEGSESDIRLPLLAPSAPSVPESDPNGPTVPQVLVSSGPKSANGPSKSIFAAPDEPATPAAIDLTTDRLFGGTSAVSAPVDDSPTQAFDVLKDDSDTGSNHPLFAPPSNKTSDESPFGEPDEKADAAMRAFFEQDGSSPEDDRGRFLRRK